MTTVSLGGLSEWESRKEEWRSLVQYLKSAGVKERCYADFAQHVKIDWPHGRSGEPLAPLLQDDIRRFILTPGFGPKKVSQSFANLRAIAIHLGWDPNGNHRFDAVTAVHQKGFPMAAYGLPESFPVSATFLTQRSRDYCSSAEIVTVVELIEKVSFPGWSASALKFDNMGKRSVAEILRLVAALKAGSKALVKEFIPIRELGGIDYGFAAEREAQEHLPIGFKGMHQRLVLGQTLDAVATQCSVTRERVRQIETLLLERISSLLDAAPDNRADFWKEWVDQGFLTSVKSDSGADANGLGIAVIERIFGDSIEGQAVLAEIERSCAACNQLLISRREFYTRELKLSEFLAQLSPAPRLVQFLEWNRRKDAFIYDEATGFAWANNPRTKQIVRALVSDASVTAIEVLNFLRKVKFGEDWTMLDLRRNYLVWCDDPEFPGSKIIFPPSNSLKSRADLIAQIARDRGQTKQIVVKPKPAAGDVLGAGYQELMALDQRLRGILAASQEAQALFGLLPVRQELQNEAIGVLKTVVRKSIERLLQCLWRLPCVTGYVLVVGPGSTMEGQAFFEPLEKYLECPIPIGRRNELTEAFKKAAQQLGLLSCPWRERTDNVGPFVYQAAIIPRFVDVLVPAILSELIKGISPDTEDVSALARFAGQVSGHINPGQARLKKVLEGAAGVAVCRILVRAYQKGNFEQLPPHLASRCTEAFQDVRLQNRDFLKSPYVHFDRSSGELFVVLPRQPQRLVRPDTLWRISSSQQFTALEETRVPLSIMCEPSIQVELSPITTPSANYWAQAIETAPTDRQPVWIFDALTGRRVQYHAEDEDGLETLRLPGGRDFYLLAAPSVTSDIGQDSWLEAGNELRSLLYESFWGQAEVMLTFLDGRKLRVASRQEPSILAVPLNGGHLQSNQDDSVFFGSGIQLTLIAPSSEGDSAEPNHLRILSTPDMEASGSEEALQDYFSRYCSTLVDGIHQIEVEFASQGKVVRRKFYFWKGLTYLDYSFGFCCGKAPANIDWARSSGIAEDRRGARLLSRWSLPDVGFALKTPSTILRLKRPGITVALLNLENGVEEPWELGRTLHVPKHDPRRIVIRLEVTGEWKVCSGDSVLKRTEDGSLSAIFRLDDIIPDRKNSIVLTARSEAGFVVSLLRLERLVAVTGLRINPDEVEDRYYVRFTVPALIKKIALVRSPLLPLSGVIAGEVITPFDVVQGLDIQDVTDLTQTCLLTKPENDGGVLVELFFPYVSLRGSWHRFELRYQDSQSSEWNTLYVADAIGAFGSRWVLSPPVVASSSDDFVRATLHFAKNRSHPETARIPDPILPEDAKSVHDAFEVLEALLDYQYSNAGWDSVRWSAEGFFWLCRRAQITHKRVLSQRAVSGLALRARQMGMNYRPLHFGSSELACSFPNQYYDLPAYPKGVVGDCFRLIGKRARHESLVAMLTAAYTEKPPAIDIWPFFHFANASAVMTKKATRFADLRSEAMLHELSRRITGFDPHSQGPDARAALADHLWADAHYSAEKRLLQLRSVARDGIGPLNEIAAFGLRLRHLHSTLRKIIRPQAGGNLDWPDLPGSEAVQVNLQLVFWIAALGRATAHGFYSRDEYIHGLGQVFAGTPENLRPIRQGLSLCIGLAPEWFALAMLLWELILSDFKKAGATGDPK